MSPRFRFAVAALLALSPHAARAQPAVRTWSDADLLFVSSDLYIPKRMIRNNVYGSTVVRSELARVGVTTGCRVIEARLAAVTRGREDELRDALVTRIRASFPAQMLAGWVAQGLFSIKFGGRIQHAIENQPPFAALPSQALAMIRSELAALPATQSPWRGRFADWDFARSGGLPYDIACNIEVHPDADAKKQIFDGFYQVRPN